jgi:hypothetical protein
MTEIISKIELLPVEYRFRKAMGIYAKRLGILLAVVLVNLSLFAFLLVISRLPSQYLVIAGVLLLITVVRFIPNLIRRGIRKARMHTATKNTSAHGFDTRPSSETLS